MSWQIEHADVLDWAAGYEGPQFHAMLCDPPYHLIQDTRNGSMRQLGTGPYGRHKEGTKGFMNKTWDGGGIAFQPETWAALVEHLLPGAFVMAFGGSRTYHRLACALEDAGLIIHSSIVWCFGSGFPKATNISSQIDKMAGAEQIEVGTKRSGYGKRNGVKDSEGGIFLNSLPEDLKHIPIMQPATPLAATWAGHRYGLQALKPAAEFICVAQKPYAGRPVDSIVETGAGALWVDGGRIGIDRDERTVIDNRSGSDDGKRNGIYQDGLGYRLEGEKFKSHPQGRWPANFVLSHIPPDADGNGGCRKVGTRRVKAEKMGNTKPAFTGNNGIYGKYAGEQPHVHYADPDGLELVDAWECEEGGSYTTYQYAYRNDVLSPLSEPSFLLDQLQSLIGVIRNYNTACNNLLPRASEVYHSGHKLSAVSDGDLLDAALYGLALKGVPGFQFGCQSCHRLCGEYLRQVLGACQDGLPSLLDALGHVHQDLSEPLHNPQSQCPCRPSNLDGSGQNDSYVGNLESRISGEYVPSELPELACHTEDKAPQEWRQSEQPEHIHESKTCEVDNRGIPCCNAGRTALVKLLCLLSFDLAWRFLLPAHIIQRSEIVVNYSKCPVRALGEQSGERPSGEKKPGQGSMPITIGATGLAGKSNRNHFEADTGTAARFFFQAGWEYEIAERLAGAEPFYYCAKSSRRERDAGLDSCEIIMVQLHQENKSSGGVTWELEDRQVRLLVDTEQYPPRVIAASMTEQLDATEWSTFLFGNSTMGLSPMGGMSITLTGTNSITESKTLSWWIRSLTSAYTQDVNSGMGNGGSHAESVELSNPSVSFTNVNPVCLPGVGNVASGTQWTISASEGPCGSKQKGPVMNRVCINCNKGELDGRRDGPCCDSPQYVNAAPRGNVRNFHPTIKPIALTRYLATLLLPPPAYAPRRIVIPFGGVMSEAIGAGLAGWEEITAIERELEYVEIGEARLRHWLANLQLEMSL